MKSNTKQVDNAVKEAVPNRKLSNGHDVKGNTSSTAAVNNFTTYSNGSNSNSSTVTVGVSKTQPVVAKVINVGNYAEQTETLAQLAITCLRFNIEVLARARASGCVHSVSLVLV